MIGRIVAGVLLAGMAAQALAAGSVAGKVIDVRVDRGGQGIVTFDQQIATPGCGTPAYANAFAFDANTAGGKAILAVVLAAKTTGDLVYGYGAGTCLIYNGVVEDLNYTQIH